MELKILGHRIKVRYQKEFGREHAKCGHYDPVKQEIVIDASLDRQVQASTLLHEIIEVLDVELNLKLDHAGHICKLEAGLFQVLRDNPAMVKLVSKGKS